MIAPRIATAIPASCFLVGASRRNTAEIATMNAGCMFTSVTDAAIVVRWSDAFHAQKWNARAIPAATATPVSRIVRRRHSRHSPVMSNANATITSENSRRHAATTSGSAFDNLVSGPAKEIPTKLRVRTPVGDGFIGRDKKQSEVARKRSRLATAVNYASRNF